MKRQANAKPVVPIYQLKISLEYIRPMIWRRVLVPSDITLPKLHATIQRAFGWEDYHLHAFRVGDVSYAPHDPNFPDDFSENEQRVRLNEIAPAEKSKFGYEYDFGDSWRHKITVEKILPAEEVLHHPVCVAGKRAGPPEDCGGPWGYADFVEAITDPDHEEHEDLLEWVGGEFDPEAFDLEAINAELRKLRL